MLLRYQQGLLELFKSQLDADVTVNIARLKHHLDNVHIENIDLNHSLLPSNVSLNAKSPNILALWQALHLQQLLPILAKVLTGNTATQAVSAPYVSILQTIMAAMITQLDPSGQVFIGLNAGARSMLIIIAYRLANGSHSKATLNTDQSNTIIDLRRYARLINIDLKTVSTDYLQWLLLTAQALNSIQLFALINAVTAIEKNSQTLYNSHAESHYRLWLSTLPTVILNDMIITQHEYDCLVVLSEQWLGERQLFG